MWRLKWCGKPDCEYEYVVDSHCLGRDLLQPLESVHLQREEMAQLLLQGVCARIENPNVSLYF